MRRRHRARSRPNKQAPIGTVPNTEPVLFDHRFAEFPVAATVPRAPRARAIALEADLHRWLATRWQWLKPRTVPCAVAALGMIAVLAFSNYLTNLDDGQSSQTTVDVPSLSASSHGESARRHSVQVVPSYIAH
jgi:hypothetical protein